MSYRLDLSELSREAKERNTVISFTDSATDECFRVLPNGTLELPEWDTVASYGTLRQWILKTANRT